MTTVQNLEAPPAEPVALDVDPFDPDVLRQPIAAYAAMREAAPVVYLPRYDTYAITRYREVRQALISWKGFTSAAGVGLGDIRKGELWLSPSRIVEVDPPDHTQVRSAMNRIISPRVVRSWRGAFEREAERMVTAVLGQDEFDAVRSIAEAFVLKVFPDALGIGGPRPDRVGQRL